MNNRSEDGLRFSGLAEHDRDLLQKAVDHRLRLFKTAKESVDERDKHVVDVADSQLLRLRQVALDVVEVNLAVIGHEAYPHTVLK